MSNQPAIVNSHRMEETVTDSNPGQQMNNVSSEFKLATEKFLSEFNEQFAKRAKVDKILRFELAIMLLLVWTQIAIDLF